MHYSAGFVLSALEFVFLMFGNLFLIGEILRLVEAARLGLLVLLRLFGFFRTFSEFFPTSEVFSEVSEVFSLPSTIAGLTSGLPSRDPGGTADAAPPVCSKVLCSKVA